MNLSEMNLAKLTAGLAGKGVALWFEGERLRFRAPKGALGEEERALLSSNRAEVLAHLRAEAAKNDTIQPLSFSQRSLWFIHQQAPTSNAYHIALPARIRGVVDAAALQNAFQGIVDRHAALRTTYGEEDGTPVQRVRGNVVARLEVHAAPDLDEAALREAVEADFRRPFDLEHGPIVRVSLHSISAGHHVLLLAVHHIAADGWSLLMMFDELLALYAESSGGAAANLARPSLEYTDYSRWQEEMLSGPEGERLWNYWREKLAPPRAHLQLPTDFPRPAVRTFRGSAVELQLDATLTDRVKVLARAQGTTLFVLLLASFNALLYRLGETDDVIVGTPTFARGKAELLHTVGDFVNSVPVRARLDETMSFLDLVAQLRTTVLEALDAQEFPFPLLVRRLQPDRDSSRSPLFDTFFVFQRFDQFRQYEKLLAGAGDGAVIETGGLRLSGYALGQQEGQFDLSLKMAEGEGKLHGAFYFNTDLFEEATVRRLAGHYRNLLEALLRDPAAPIATQPLLSTNERDWLVRGINATAMRYDEQEAFPRQFEAQVERRKDAIAIRCDGEALTYGELNARANRLADYLGALGVAPGVLTAVCLDRGVNMVVAVLGIQKAGGAYVPLDPEFPRERLGFMLADSGARVLITADEDADGIPLPESVRVLDMGKEAGAIAAANPSNRATAPRLQDPVYMIYTSGSTGRPKGVVVQHGALLNFLCSMRAEPGLSETDVLAAVTTLSFDIAGLELYLPLLVGAQVELVRRAVAIDGRLLAAHLADCGATVLQATPATWRLLVDAGFEAKALRAWCGGEALARDLAQSLLERTAQLWNLYGPTETTIWSTAARVEPGVGAVPVGRPIANTRIYVVVRRGQLAPIGVPGEIWIGGAGVALGYHQRAELTAAVFIADPFDPEPDARVYRTGDLGRWRADGSLEHLGRIDNQVKIRGYRIELEEIEATLSRHPGVRQAVVNPWHAAAGDTRLVAYVVPQPGAVLATPAMQAFLRRELPDYMMPAAILPMATFPLTPNGKIDRRALPAPLPSRQADVPSAAPRTLTEQALCEIWRDTLQLDRVGRCDDFFDLGGHSLLATQVASRIRETFQIELSLGVLFEATTLEAIALRIDTELLAQHQAPALPAIEACAMEGPAPLSFSQERMWLLHEMAPQSTAYNMPAALRLRGVLDVAALEEALNALRRRHETLRCTFHLVDGVPHQDVQPWQREPLQIQDLRALAAGAWAQALGLAEDAARRPFDLGADPVLRSTLYRMADEEHLLLLCLHHIAADQWSFGVLGRELAALYNGLRCGNAVELAPLAVQYRDYARWQRNWLQGPELERQVSFWRERLAGLPVLELPTDRPRQALASLRGAWHVAPLPAELIAALELLGRREHSTLFMTLFAGFATLLHRLTGQEDIAIGVPIANRRHVALEALVGTFINTLVLRADLSAGPSFRELLQRVRSQALDAYAHQDVPFERLVEALIRKRDTSRAPLAQVLFNVQNIAMDGIAFDELAWEPVVIDRKGTQFELSLTVYPQGSPSLVVEYSTDLFDSQTIARLVERYLELLRGVVADAGTPVHALALLPAHERQLLESWNATATDDGANAAAPVFTRLFEAQVERRKDAIAIGFDGEALTYGELNARANRLARRLRSMGVRPGVLVAVCLERSLDLAAVLLGIQKSGGAYVPLDPNFPADRLSFMLEDSAAAVLVTSGDAAHGVEVGAQVRVLDLRADAGAGNAVDADTRDSDAGIDENLSDSAAAQDPAYVIYTSGSTGRPKGVIVHHGALVNFLASMRREPGITPDDVLAAVTTISFDIAGLELYLPWVAGARVELIGHETAADGAALATQLRACGATMLQATPATWRLLLEEGWRGPPGFRGLCGGEALSRELADALLPRMEELWNLYGPTETTIWSTVARIEAGSGPITIGRPIANTQVHVLDRAGERMPIGSPGEIWIGGAGVALGYHQRTDLTAARFVPDRFAARPGARMYRTGDLGRWRPDGRLEHLGRIDHQVKVRGFRIELGEIESVLAQLQSVRQSLVVARQIADGDARLVAYVSYLDAEEPTASEVRRFLRRTLPDYMIPSVVVTLDSFPLTPNGKVDRLALPDPFLDPTTFDESANEPPAPGMEQLLADVWRDVLKIEGVAANDNFFDLGGHSLLSIRVAAAVQRATGWRMDPRTLFFQTLRQIATTAPLARAAEVVMVAEGGVEVADEGRASR